MSEVTVFIASYNTRAATELAIRSARRLAGMPFRLIVGDSDSRDGSRQMLRGLEREGIIADLVAVDAPRRHHEWLDWFLANCETPFGVVVDSDIEFLRKDWLSQLIGVLNSRNAAFVGTESTPEAAPFPTAEGEAIHLMPRPAAPWLLAFDVEKARALGVSFAEHRDGVDKSGLAHLYDVAGWIEQRAADNGYVVAAMPDQYRSSYRHFTGLSWRRERGIRSIRHYLKVGRIQIRLRLRRIR